MRNQPSKLFLTRSLLSILFVISLISGALAQSPNAIPYQGVARNATGDILSLQLLGLRFSIRDVTAAGTIVYQETQTATTTTLGLFNVNIGSGTPTLGTLGAVNWGGGAKFIQVELDASGGTAYVNMGTTQLNSVPYALFAANAGGGVPNGTASGNTLRWNGSAYVADNTIFNTGTNVGIGQAVAATRLDVNGTVKSTGLQMTTGAVAGRVLVSDAAGNATWTASTGVTGSGSNNYISKFAPAGSTITNSQIQDNGTSVAVNTTPSLIYRFYTYQQQLTANGDGQHSLFGYRTRDSQNDGISYAQVGANSATAGYNFWGDVYTFGVAGWNYNDYSRCGGTFGADVNGTFWGSLGYRSSGLLNYGVYGSAAYTSGAGFAPDNNSMGIGGGFAGGIMGSWSRGKVIGSVNSGEMFASYNVGNVLTSGYSANLVTSGNSRVPVYSVTSPELKVYDNGTGNLNGTEVYVAFSKSFASLLGDVPNVTVSPVGSPAQLYIKSINRQGFTVAIASGSANVAFSWITVGKRVDAGIVKEIPAELTDVNFDKNINEVMFDEGNTKQNATKAIWWDGTKIRFDKQPELPKKPKIEIKPASGD